MEESYEMMCAMRDLRKVQDEVAVIFKVVLTELKSDDTCEWMSDRSSHTSMYIRKSHGAEKHSSFGKVVLQKLEYELDATMKEKTHLPSFIVFYSWTDKHAHHERDWLLVVHVAVCDWPMGNWLTIICSFVATELRWFRGNESRVPSIDFFKIGLWSNAEQP